MANAKKKNKTRLYEGMTCWGLKNLNKWSADLSQGEPASLEYSDICPLVSFIHMRQTPLLAVSKKKVT